ncbi:putative glycine-rich cell wall structural protein 1 protein [Podospora conica]|nr:putative glycine-rich cell wall structural protein 1 protein [Schizothecium conicum]
MESLNNIGTAVSKAIWGTDETNTQEPISGKTGDVSKGQPYDAGNLDDTPKPSSTAPDNHPAPNKTLPSSTGPTDQTTSQSDTRHPSDPAADHHASAAKKDVDDTTGGLDVGDNPDKLLSGPGPRPLEVVAKEHGGDAGRNDAPPPKQEVESGDAPLDRHDSGHSTQGDKGLKYVKSSGLVADGGDFDAAKPGAGREADRLLDQKGVHRDPTAQGGLVANKGSADNITAGTAGEDKEKVSLKTKIKNKLHLGSHSGSGSTASVPA